MKPKLFVGSSRESIDFAYAVQENLQNDADVTVWDQGAFELGLANIENLLSILENSDFGAFVFAPDDVTRIRGNEARTVRDNVIFELGLFIGRLGRERSFFLVPVGQENLHIPSDLLGVASATFPSKRDDENWRAALGPACNQVRRRLVKMGPINSATRRSQHTTSAGSPITDPDDIRATLVAWIGQRTPAENHQLIRFAEVDQNLDLPNGSAKAWLTKAAAQWGYRILDSGRDTILFRKGSDSKF